jgi:hypothetical protein
MAAAVSAPSTLRLVSAPVALESAPGAGFSGKLASEDGFGALEDVEVGTVAKTGAAGLEATGLAVAGDGADSDSAAMMPTGALWRPSE